jgi:hypothetical protein
MVAKAVVAYVALVLCCVAVVTFEGMTNPAEKVFTQVFAD